MRHSVWGNARPVPNRMLEKQPQDQPLPVLYIQVLPVELCSSFDGGPHSWLVALPFPPYSSFRS